MWYTLWPCCRSKPNADNPASVSAAELVCVLLTARGAACAFPGVCSAGSSQFFTLTCSQELQKSLQEYYRRSTSCRHVLAESVQHEYYFKNVIWTIIVALRHPEQAAAHNRALLLSGRIIIAGLLLHDYRCRALTPRAGSSVPRVVLVTGL